VIEQPDEKKPGHWSDEFMTYLLKGVADKSVDELDRAIKEGRPVRLPDSSVSDGSTADYYQLPPDATELQDLISYRDMNAQIGEVFRACYRYGRSAHSDKLRDARKIMFYARAEVERLEKYGDVETSQMTHNGDES
jgi:hypothetical protein